jgi:hypothetical protein
MGVRRGAKRLGGGRDAYRPRFARVASRTAGEISGSQGGFNSVWVSVILIV